MVLFLVFTIPLLGLLYIRLFYRSFFSMAEVRVSFLYGLLAQLVAIVPILLIHIHMPLRYTAERLFLADFVREFFVYWAFGIVASGILKSKNLRMPTIRGKWVSSLAFWTGFLFLAGLYHAVYHFPGYTPYRLFLYPVLLLLLLWGGGLSSYILFALTGVGKKIIALVSGPAFSLLFTLIPFTFSINLEAWGYIGFGAVVVLFVIGGYLVETKKLPIR